MNQQDLDYLIGHIITDANDSLGDYKAAKLTDEEKRRLTAFLQQLLANRRTE